MSKDDDDFISACLDEIAMSKKVDGLIVACLEKAFRGYDSPHFVPLKERETMGLSTTHDCWHGSYGSFMYWRSDLHALAAPTFKASKDLPEIAQKLRRARSPAEDSLFSAWDENFYDDKYPLCVLMNHSDAEGSIEHKDCKPLAEALKELLAKMPSESSITRRQTEQFIAGLLRAHEAGEDVEFH